MFTRLLGAIARALCVVAVVLTPSLLLPDASPAGAQLAMLVALACAVVTAFEYGARHPGVIAFRDAAPFNRIRIVALFLMLTGLSLIAGMTADGSSLTMVIAAIGHLVGTALDFPLSPLHAMLDMTPGGGDPAQVFRLQAMAGIAFLTTLVALFTFSTLNRLERWPGAPRPFNIWINLPTFDPSAGGDVVKRLSRVGYVNVLFGLLAPFILPVGAGIGADWFQIPLTGSPQMMVWAVTLWMFLPLNLVMRGLALLRISRLVRAHRSQVASDMDARAMEGALPSSAA